jgi:hypothetical protein
MMKNLIVLELLKFFYDDRVHASQSEGVFQNSRSWNIWRNGAILEHGASHGHPVVEAYIRFQPREVVDRVNPSVNWVYRSLLIPAGLFFRLFDVDYPGKRQEKLFKHLYIFPSFWSRVILETKRVYLLHKRGKNLYFCIPWWITIHLFSNISLLRFCVHLSLSRMEH